MLPGQRRTLGRRCVAWGTGSGKGRFASSGIQKRKTTVEDADTGGDNPSVRPQGAASVPLLKTLHPVSTDPGSGSGPRPGAKRSRHLGFCSPDVPRPGMWREQVLHSQPLLQKKRLRLQACD